MITLYGYKNCSSCRNAEKFLTQEKISYSFIDITTSPPSYFELKKMFEGSGLEIKRFLNTSGEVYRELGLKDKLAGMSQEEVLKLLASNGRLIKRPLISDGKRVTLGFKLDELSLWKSLSLRADLYLKISPIV